MKLPKQILVPIDFSSHAAYALDYALALAAKLDATVHLLHVVGFPAMGLPELGVAISATMIDQIMKDTQAGLDRLADAHRSRAKLGQVILRTGDAREVILHTREELGADLIVMGTHGRRGVSRALLGSVAESIVRTSPVPVITMHAVK